MFEGSIGNEPVKARLRKLLSEGRVPNALLFSGPNGVGKKQFALESARSFVCTAGEKLACGKCSACRRVGEFDLPKPDNRDGHEQTIAGLHPDVKLVIPYKRNILVEAIRDLEREANFRPFEARARIFIIDDADKMNDAASNALLKTLEEPPATTYLFLITSRPDKLLPTIRSRTQHIRFAPVDTQEIASLLTARGKFAADDAVLAAKLSGGSIGDALSIDIEKHKERREMMLDILKAAAVSRDRAFLLLAEETLNSAKFKDELENAFAIFESLVHDAWIACKGFSGDSFANIDIADEIENVAKSGAPFDKWLEMIEEMRGNFAVNINRKAATDSLFMRMAG